jgi:hypothetical protein
MGYLVPKGYEVQKLLKVSHKYSQNSIHIYILYTLTLLRINQNNFSRHIFYYYNNNYSNYYFCTIEPLKWFDQHKRPNFFQPR